MSARRTLTAVLACAPALFAAGTAAQSLPRDLTTWTVDYAVAIGLAGIVHRVTVSSNGSILVRNAAGNSVDGGVAPDLLAKIADFLKTARDAQPSKRPPMPDAGGATLTAKVGAREYPLQTTPAIVDILNQASNAALSHAVLGEWWQSAWTLCKPADRITAADTDPPIESLIFGTDGRFSVTWMHGARTAGGPPAGVPDYRGRYSVDPSRGSLELLVDDGAAVPRDFSGRGRWRINGNQLTLIDMWLGTRAAGKRPDICELTFTRK